MHLVYGTSFALARPALQQPQGASATRGESAHLPDRGLRHGRDDASPEAAVRAELVPAELATCVRRAATGAALRRGLPALAPRCASAASLCNPATAVSTSGPWSLRHQERRKSAARHAHR